MESVFEILSYVFWVILAITILVFVHEMGHFLFAKLFGMRVDRFSVGFPPKIFGKTVGETEYVVGATPLGGYVKIAGMIDESMDTDYLESEPEPWEFRSKPVWQRMVVISAGVIFNVILAFFIFTGLKLAYGETYIPAENVDAIYVADSSIAYDMGLRTGDRIHAVSGNVFEEYEDLASIESLIADPFTITAVRDGDTLTMEGPSDIFTQLNRRRGLGISIDPAVISGIIAGTPADSIGLRGGDRIVSVSGEDIRYWAEMNGIIQASGGAPIRIRWLRPDSLAEGVDVPAFVQTVDETSVGTIYEASVRPTQRDGSYLLGVYAPTSLVVAQEFGELRRDFSVFGAAGVGLADTWTNTKGIAVSLGRVFTGQENFRENVGGPIMIAQITKQAADAGALYFWNIVAMLSITLAIINILPIPVLDGGHLVFLLYEGIVRREPSLRFRMITQQIGMILLLVFMTFLIFNDILRL
ncbi:MAG: RIP metalloprotease RseP [Rhodothermales bacterium]